ncbi:helix-turn-helix transcriptional regulator [Microvirga sp. 0TCS3.31]
MPLGKPLLDALDRMGYGGIILDTTGQIIRINQMANELLSGSLAPGEPPGCSDSREALKALLRSEATTRLTMNSEEWAVIRRDTTGQRPLILHAVHLDNQALFGPHTVIILVDLQATPHLAQETLQKIFGLTPAEAKLAIEIAAGQSLDDIAEAHHVSVATARKQLASVFAKTYTHRQAELVALLARVSILP